MHFDFPFIVSTFEQAEALAQGAFGKASFDAAALSQNLHALLADLIKAKPAQAKGQYLQKISLSSTMGVGVTVDQGSLTIAK